MKRTLLFPTDFSENADHALDYAVAMAGVMDAEILVFHAYSIVLVNTDMPYTLVEKELEEVKHRAVKGLEGILHKIKSKNPSISASYILKQGFPSSDVIEIAKEKDADMIVMGTQGAGAVKALVFGSNAAEVIEKASCPVFAIPKNAVFKEIRSIVYASDYYDSDIHDIHRLASIAKEFDADITILNVSDEGKEIQKAVTELFVRDLREKISYPKIDVALVEDDDIAHGIEKYIKENPIDMLVMSTRKRGFIEKLVDRSLTKKMAYHAQVPLLAFHHKVDF
ncbi:MAG: universal stress protein [Cytophagaceae bacterium]